MVHVTRPVVTSFVAEIHWTKIIREGMAVAGRPGLVLLLAVRAL